MTNLLGYLIGIYRVLLNVLGKAVHALSFSSLSDLRSCFCMEHLIGQELLVKAFMGIVLLVPAPVLLSLITLSGSYWMSLTITFLLSSLLLLFQSKLKIPRFCLSA